jgi:glycosyltransferase involved in cell wall biosynthesis
MARRHRQDSGYVLDLFAMSPYYCGALVKALQDEGFPVALLSVTPRNDTSYFSGLPLTNSRGILDVTTRLGMIRHDRVRQIVRVMEYLLNLILLAATWTVRRPRFVHVQWLPLLERSGTKVELVFLRWLKRLRIPVIYTVHNLVPHDQGAAPGGARAVFELAERLICHTDASRDVLIGEHGVPPSKASVGEGFVLFAGNIRPYKGVDLLLEAWPAVLKGLPGAQLVIAGGGDPAYLKQIEAMANGIPPGSIRLLLGFVPSSEMGQLHRKAAFMVFPYRQITQSGALLTAIAYGKPVVATRLPGFVETLKEGEHAVFSDPHDAKGLARAMLRLLQDDEARQGMSAAVRDLCESRFSWKEIARRTAQTYRTSPAASLSSEGLES